MALNFTIDETLVNAMVDSGQKGFRLGERSLTPVGIGRMAPLSLASVSGIIGIVGRVNGSILVNLSEAAAISVASGMLQSPQQSLTAEVLDGVAEVTNVIGGRMKSSLATSGYPLDAVTLPSVIVGQSYIITQSRGILCYSVTFTLEDDTIPQVSDRIVQVALTVMTSQLRPSAGADGTNGD